MLNFQVKNIFTTELEYQVENSFKQLYFIH